LGACADAIMAGSSLSTCATANGMTQVVFNPEVNPEVHAKAHQTAQ
jgi:hypothetical protein